MRKSRYLTHRFFFSAICFMCLYSAAAAQPISVRVTAGMVDLPLSDWSEFFGSQGHSPYFLYTKNNPNPYYALSINYKITPQHSVYVGTELIQSSASSSDSVDIMDWKFQGIPITIGYEYKILTFNRFFSPLIGGGVSYFISQVTGKDYYFNQTLKRTGNGYGIHASLGLVSQLTESLDMITQARYRYSNGMAFTDKSGSIKVEFSGFDFSIGLEYSL
jgi:hypothetical protein